MRLLGKHRRHEKVTLVRKKLLKSEYIGEKLRDYRDKPD